MVGLPDFRSHSKSRPFANQPLLDHLKSRLGRILDPRCSLKNNLMDIVTLCFFIKCSICSVFRSKSSKNIDMSLFLFNQGESVKSPCKNVKAHKLTVSKICQPDAGPTAANLTQPDKRLPLPKKYKFLAEVFDILDQVQVQ